MVDPELSSNCKRHGGTAFIINCWECYAEFREDDVEIIEEDEE